jgi:hypothetical protein
VWHKLHQVKLLQKFKFWHKVWFASNGDLEQMFIAGPGAEYMVLLRGVQFTFV